MGVFEVSPFSKGTFKVAHAVADNAGSTSIVGGGDSVAAVHAAGVADKITHISTGGGASLEFLEGKKLPGVEALTNKGISMQLPEDYVVDLTVQDPPGCVCSGEIVPEYPADAIVNAANADLLPGGGVCGAIHYKGGPEIARECGRLRRMDGPLRPGQAVATTGGNLQVKYVIHAVGPVWEGGNRGEARALASVYRESMRVADDLKLANIAFPAISTGIYRYPLRELLGSLSPPVKV